MTRKLEAVLVCLFLLVFSLPVSAASIPDHGFCLDEVTRKNQERFTVVHDNVPWISWKDGGTTCWTRFQELDALGRTQSAIGNLGAEIMPAEKRGSIGMVKPSGWQTVKYDHIDGRYLYNRCHLLGYQLTGENANPNNLITGTRQLNVEGMLPFENMVADYIKETGNHVLMHTSPIYHRQELVARGILMEGVSIEDQGKGILFCVFVWNVQDGVKIDYATGKSTRIKEPEKDEVLYVLNTNTKKFHRSTCSSTKDMKPKNTRTSREDRDAILALGYQPCKRCNP